MEHLVSRRELFQKLLLHKSSMNSTTISHEETSSGREAVGWSRRDFLKFLAGLGAALSLGQITNTKVEATLSRVPAENVMVKSQEQILPFSNLNAIPISDRSVHTFTETTIETSLLVAANIINHRIFQRLGIPEGNRSISKEDWDRLLKNKPIQTLFLGGVLAPISEEWLFRLIPSELLAGRSKEHRWDIGIPTSAIFALAHNIQAPISMMDDYDRILKRTLDVKRAVNESQAYIEDVTKKVPSEVLDMFKQVKFARSVPMSQFMSGLFLWYLMREKGYDQAVFAHLTNNALAFTMGKLLLKKYPPRNISKT